MRREELARVAQPVTAFAVGDPVRVCTRMGRPVVEGAVAGVGPRGLGVGGRFFAAELYCFLGEDAHARASVEEAKQGKKPKLGKLDSDALPEELRKAVTVDEDMTEDQIERVLAAVGDAARKAMVGCGVRESEVYARVAAIQTAVKAVVDARAGEAETATQADARAKRAAAQRDAKKDDEGDEG